MTGREFEELCKDILVTLGMQKTEITKSTGDQGADIIAYLGNNMFIFQCKHHKKKLGNKAVQQAIAARTYYKANRCGVISHSEYTKSAYNLAHPNYCLLFTYEKLASAANANLKFEDLIRDIKFPPIVPVEHDYDLIGKYEELKSKLGHVPRNDDFDPTTLYYIRKKYGSLTNLLTAIGDKPFSRRPTDSQIREEYGRIRDSIGRTPTLEDMTTNSDFSRSCFASYTFTKLQRECGDLPNVERGVSKKQLISAFNKLKNRLGRTPNLKDIDEQGYYRSSYYRTRWGNINNFLKEMKIPQASFKQRTYEEEEVILIYLFLKKAFEIREDNIDFQLNHTVLEKLKYNDRSFIAPKTFSKRFGSWYDFMEYLNSSKKVRLISKALNQVVSDIKSK